MNILALGDSYAAGVGATPNWLDYLTIPQEYRLGVPGSTAAEWNTGKYQVPNDLPCEIAVISLLANDATAAASDGLISPEEVIDGFDHLFNFIRNYSRLLTFIVQYPDPSFGADEFKARSTRLINRMVRIVVMQDDEFHNHFTLPLDLVLDKDCFDSGSIHPNTTGHLRIARLLYNKLQGYTDGSVLWREEWLGDEPMDIVKGAP